ncbi:MAG: DUF4276 family protein [Desulfomonilaceae bacterium]|nr:DUF4276 family protein [Desulfomonilaceae bacterium]
MDLEFFVEEPSAEAALKAILPKMLPNYVRFDVHAFRGKTDMLEKLPSRLKGMRWRFQESKFGIVVLIDEDRQNCREVKQTLEDSAVAAGLTSKSSVMSGDKYQVLNRVAVEELEAWFFGDAQALHKAYPRVPVSVGDRAAYRNPDSIKGGTWEALEKLLRNHGYHRGGLNKIEAAGAIAVHMHPDRNRSKSFQVFRDGLREFIGYHRRSDQ